MMDNCLHLSKSNRCTQIIKGDQLLNSNVTIKGVLLFLLRHNELVFITAIILTIYRAGGDHKLLKHTGAALFSSAHGKPTVSEATAKMNEKQHDGGRRS